MPVLLGQEIGTLVESLSKLNLEGTHAVPRIV